MYNTVTMAKTNRTWHIYLLRCSDGTLYTGITVDPARRVQSHNAGRGARYTRTRLPVELVASREVTSQSEAMRLEKRIKTFTPQRKLAFFAGDPHA